MHFRWSFADDRRLAAASLAREVVRLPLPAAIREAAVARRQTKLFVRGDGIDSRTRVHAERSVGRAFACLEPVLTRRGFLFGDRPTIADIGLMGPFWRHFVHDPTPAKLLQDTAPATFAWTGRMWNARAGVIGGRPLLDGVPSDLGPLLLEVGATHLEALDQNADAHARGVPTHDLTVQGTTYRDVPTSAYRIWCLEELRARFDALAADARGVTEALLRRYACWEPLWRTPAPASGHDPRGEAPFCPALRMVRD